MQHVVTYSGNNGRVPKGRSVTAKASRILGLHLHVLASPSLLDISSSSRGQSDTSLIVRKKWNALEALEDASALSMRRDRSLLVVDRRERARTVNINQRTRSREITLRPRGRPFSATQFRKRTLNKKVPTVKLELRSPSFLFFLRRSWI